MKLRERIVVYLTRPAPDGTEVLAFGCDHGGWQTIAGGVEINETPADAARREAQEEAGVDVVGPVRRLNTTMFRYSGHDVWCVQHFLAVDAPDDLPETWEHCVTGEGVECGRIHRLAWLPARHLDWLVAGQGNAASFLETAVPPTPRGDVQLRDAGESDVAFIRTLRNHYVATSAAIYTDDAWTQAEAEKWVGDRDVGMHPIFIAEIKEKPVGFGCLGPFDSKSGYRATAEDTIYVAPDAQGRGVGTRLLSALISRGLEAGVRSVIARIDTRQPASLALHLRHGFVPAGVLREAGRKFGEWRDVAYLQRLLDDA